MHSFLRGYGAFSLDRFFEEGLVTTKFFVAKCSAIQVEPGETAAGEAEICHRAIRVELEAPAEGSLGFFEPE